MNFSDQSKSLSSSSNPFQSPGCELDQPSSSILARFRNMVLLGLAGTGITLLAMEHADLIPSVASNHFEVIAHCARDKAASVICGDDRIRCDDPGLSDKVFVKYEFGEHCTLPKN